MRISVIGLGYLGVTHAVAMAKLGHQVIGIDPDLGRIQALSSGRVPFFEPGLEQALQEVLGLGLVEFAQNHSEKSRAVELHFICVGTPQTPGGNAADTSYVFAAAKELARYLSPNSIVAGKSTVPVGTARLLKNVMEEISGKEVQLVWNPEFLREGTALKDSLEPDRIVVGAIDKKSVDTIRNAYAAILEKNVPLVEVNLETAELVKVAANAFLATKISFINAMAEIAEVSGADAVELAKAIGYDDRIGNKFLRTGIGFGGGCLPKDLRGLISRAEELGKSESVAFLREIDSVNLRRRDRVVDLASTLLEGVVGKTIAMLGISFKPDSDDLRDSPALEIAQRLRDKGALVRVHDPVSLGALALKDPGFELCPSVNSAVEGADLVVLATEWEEYKNMEPADLHPKHRLVIDGRNVLDVEKWQTAGWKIMALGRNL